MPRGSCLLLGAVILTLAKVARWRAIACLAATAMLLSGCASFFQGFGPLTSSYLYDIPVSTVTNQVACELEHFLSLDETVRSRIRLNPDDEAKITLTLQTDTTGNVGYVGIDLNKLGFAALADFVAIKANVPSLGVRGQIKSTVSAAVEVRIAQRASKLTSKTCRELLGRTVRTLFLNEWLTDFFKRMREDDIDKRFADVRMSSVTLKTDFQILADISTG